jgi:undecaprenyl-diphosphatase
VLAAAAQDVTPHIPVLHAIVLGITQGLSEFFPISSSGHLILVPWLFNWNELDKFPELSKTFDVALHLGTLVGAVAYFWRDLARLIPAGVRAAARRHADTTEERIAWLLLLSAIPGAIVGASLESFIEEYLGAPWLIAVMLIVFGLVLYFADHAAERLSEDDFRTKQAATMGIAQALALSPGVSRSGVTISAGRYLGFRRDDVARLSFLMSLPITAGAVVFKGTQLAVDGMPPGMAPAFVWGIVASAATGLFAIYVVFRLVRTRTYTPFVVYRIALGAGVLGIIASGARPAT